MMTLKPFFGSTAVQIVGFENVVVTTPKFFNLASERYAFPLSISNFVATMPTEVGPNRNNPV